MNRIVLGQFVPGESPIHRLDPRTKILAKIAYIVLVFLVKALAAFAVPLLLVLGALLCSGIPARYALTSLRPMRWLIAFMFVLNLFFTQGERVLFSWWIIRVTAEGLRQAVFISIRLVLLVAGTSLLTLTTSPIALTDGLERLLKPLRRIRFPVHELAMMMSIALRFLPTLLEETERIRKAQMARGADFETGGRLARARALVPLLVPLFVSSFRRADELAMAKESRCYHGGEGRTRMHELHYARRDLAAALVIALTLAAVPVLQLWI